MNSIRSEFDLPKRKKHFYFLIILFCITLLAITLLTSASTSMSILNGSFLNQIQNQKNKDEKTVSNTFEINKSTGLVQGIPFYPAPFPNSEHRADAEDISVLVIHDTEIVAPENSNFEKSVVHYMFTQRYDLLKKEFSAKFDTIYPEGIRHVAAHFVIRRSGEIIQYVPLNRLAHHAGISEYEKREDCNEYSIGIELEGYANRQDFPYTEAQYQQLAKLTSSILNTYPKITVDRITSHEEIARPIGRKNDPGETFDWEKYKTLIKKAQRDCPNQNQTTSNREGIISRNIPIEAYSYIFITEDS